MQLVVSFAGAQSYLLLSILTLSPINLNHSKQKHINYEVNELISFLIEVFCCWMKILARVVIHF